jgi:hypothetical protein
MPEQDTFVVGNESACGHSEIQVQPRAEEVDRPAIVVVSRVGDVLIVDRPVYALDDFRAVVNFVDILGMVAQSAIAKKSTQSARGQICRVCAGQSVVNVRNANGIVGAMPARSLDR